MSLQVRIDTLLPFCEMAASSEEKKLEQSSRYLDIFEKNIWPGLEFEGVSKAHIRPTVYLGFLCALMTNPQSALSLKEEQTLKKAKGFEKKTKFFLNTPGALILMTAALASGVAGGAGFYYGLNPASTDVVCMALLIGTATLISSLASNMLGFYITGTLPNSASEADNAEQNMWDDFAVLKTKPAAYHLLQLYSPRKKEDEEDISFNSRRALAKSFIEKIKFDDIILEFKSKSTQLEKIDIAFRYLQEAKMIIQTRARFEKEGAFEELKSFQITSDLSLGAHFLGYFS